MKHGLSLMVILLSGLGACADRTHMREGYGESTRNAMARQIVNRDAGSTSAGQGLDPQEAAILARSLQRSMAPKGEALASEPTVTISPQAQKPRGDQLPPPSVPNEGR